MNTKRFLGLVLRIGSSVALLIFLFSRLDNVSLSEILPDWDAGTPFWLIGALSLTMASFVLASMRWMRVLRALGLRETTPRLFSHYMAGQFVSNFVPTTVGGDVLRISRLTRDTGNGPASFTSVVFERLSGWLVLPVFTFTGLLVNSGLRELGAATRVSVILAALTISALTIIILAVGNPVTGRFLTRFSGWARFAQALHLGLDAFRRNPGEAYRLVGVSFAYQGVLLLAAFLAARAIGIDEVGLTALMAFYPAVLIIQVLPLGLGGLGIRETAMVFFLSRLDVPDERAIGFGLLLGVLIFVCSIIGFPALILGGRPRDRRLTALIDDGPLAHLAGAKAGDNGRPAAAGSPEDDQSRPEDGGDESTGGR